MSSKFNVNIQGGSGHIFMGDNTNVDIQNANRSAQQRPTVNIHPRDPGFTINRRSVPESPAHGQESGDEYGQRYIIKQGFALIIHNQYFPKGNLDDRVGSECDVEMIKVFCQTAGLRINSTDRNTENLSATEMDSLCSEIAQRDFSRHDAFVCFILSHGNEDGIYGTDGNTISIQEIVTKFKECRSLVGKPKLFFIQACRGTSKDTGIDSDSYPVERPIPLRRPTESDILIAHSTSEGYESYRVREMGSWFMLTLMSMLEKHAHKMHVMDILTRVNNAMAGEETPGGLRQMPCQMTTLTKSVYFNYPPPLSS